MGKHLGQPPRLLNEGLAQGLMHYHCCLVFLNLSLNVSFVSEIWWDNRAQLPGGPAAATPSPWSSRPHLTSSCPPWLLPPFAQAGYQFVSRQGDPILPSAPCRRSGNRCRECGGWGWTAGRLGKKHDSVVPTLGWQCHGAFDLVGASHWPHLGVQWMLEVGIPWGDGGDNGLRGPRWAEATMQQKGLVLNFPAALSCCTWAPQSCTSPNVLQQPPPFSQGRSWTTAMKTDLWKPVLTSYQLNETQIVFCFSEPISTIKITKLIMKDVSTMRSSRKYV